MRFFHSPSSPNVRTRPSSRLGTQDQDGIRDYQESQPGRSSSEAGRGPPPLLETSVGTRSRIRAPSAPRDERNETLDSPRRKTAELEYPECWTTLCQYRSVYRWYLYRDVPPHLLSLKQSPPRSPPVRFVSFFEHLRLRSSSSKFRSHRPRVLGPLSYPPLRR